MMHATLKIGTASALALAIAAPASAQYYRPTPEYQAAQAQYNAQRAQYENSRDAYYQSRQDYRDARRDYERRLGDWERQRASYDARYGYGAYARRYAAPTWDEAYWSNRYGASASAGYYGADASGSAAAYQSRAEYRQARRDYDRRLAEWERARARYDARYGYGAYERRYDRPSWDEATWSNRYNSAPYAGYYSSNASVSGVPCNNDNKSTVTAGVIGALAGAVLGSNVAARNARTEGAVLGAVVGGGLGAAVGRANDKYKCDSRGPYFSYDETIPYREAATNRSSRYSYYTQQRCRLAPAPVDNAGNDYRYVRVCPDAEGRYRITG